MDKFDMNAFVEDVLDFAKKYLFCVRDVYEPVTCSNSEFSGPIFPFFAPGDNLTLFMWSIYTMELNGDDTFEYRFTYNETAMRSYDKETSVEYAFCCGCRRDTDQFIDFPRSIISKEIPHKEGENCFQLAIKRMEEIRKKQNVGCYEIIQNGQLNKELFDKMVPIVKEELENLRPEVPFLMLTAVQGKYEPYVDYISYKHLALRVDKRGGEVTLTDKMVACGFLSINAVITNPEKLEEFKGFGLIIGQASENGFGVDRFCEEIEKSLKNEPLSFECFGLYDNSIDWKSDEIITRLTSYSSRKTTVSVNGDIEFNDEKDSAIIFRCNDGACFATNGWQKWDDVLNLITLTLVQW